MLALQWVPSCVRGAVVRSRALLRHRRGIGCGPPAAVSSAMAMVKNSGIKVTRAIRHTVLSVRDLLATAGLFVVLAIALLVVAYWLLDPTPPRRLVMASGSE